MIQDLLDLANEIARRDPNRPKSASLRRAASTAYYALFHALAGLCAEQLVGLFKPWRVFTPVYRALDHRRARLALNSKRNDRQADPVLKTIANAFAALQDARYDADYSPERFRFNRNDTIELIDLAEQAIAFLAVLRPELKLELAVILIVRPRSSGDRQP